MTFRVQLHGSQKQFSVEPDETLLEAALGQDIALPYGCQSGGCGACRARVIEGNVSYEYDPPALNAQEKAAGFALLCQARANSDLIIQVDELPDHHAIQVRNMPVRVERREKLCHDVMALWLKLPKGEILEFLPGQYLDILMRDGRRRSFSIANSPENFRSTGLLELQLRFVPGGRFTEHVFNDMGDRAMLRVEVPLGGFYLREDNDRDTILVAGGTGFAPLKSIVEHIAEKTPERRIDLYWGARSRRDLYQHELALQWQNELPHFQYTPVLSEPRPEDSWQGRQGFVHQAVCEDYPGMADLDVYMSGPPVMIEAGRTAFAAQGLLPEHLFFDTFDYAYETWPEK